MGREMKYFYHEPHEQGKEEFHTKSTKEEKITEIQRSQRKIHTSA